MRRLIHSIPILGSKPPIHIHHLTNHIWVCLDTWKDRRMGRWFFPLVPLGPTGNKVSIQAAAVADWTFLHLGAF